MDKIPTWVFVLFFVLFYMGIKACYDRSVSVLRLFIFPLFFSFFCLKNMETLFNFSLSGFAFLFYGVVSGLVLSKLFFGSVNIKAGGKDGLILIPGSFYPLIMAMTAFFTEFFIHYSLDENLYIAKFVFFKLFAIFLSGLFAGVSIGRSFSYFLKYRKSVAL